MISRVPRGPLRLFVERVWLADDGEDAEGADADADADAEADAGAREIAIPTGSMHLAVRLAGPPIRIFDGETGASSELGHAVVGGARSRFFLKDVTGPRRAIGAMLAPGAALPLLGAPADAFAERHVALADVWGAGATRMREQLLEAPPGETPEAQLARFEALLAARLPRVRGLHPAVAHALARLGEGGEVAAAVDESGYSHRRFLTLFREAVGLSPKRYGRVHRVKRVLEAMRSAPEASWAALAAGAGYTDQAHLTRELSEIAGVTPGEYRRIAPVHAHHVPLRR
jgi:AraC-like DNA-binding protein